MDLGVDSGRAAKVEAIFDDLTEFDEKAEATAAGRITEALVNIGIPAVRGMKVGAQLQKMQCVLVEIINILNYLIQI